jgi:hypothetical protein
VINYRNVLKIYRLEQELAPDDIALLNTLREMPEAIREMFAETLGPPVKVKTAARQRKVEHCGVCDRSGRAAVHKDVTLSDYHEFQSLKPKSPRAISLATVISGTTKPTVLVGDGPLCTICNHPEDYEDHAQPSPHYHEFEAAGAKTSVAAGD